MNKFSLKNLLTISIAVCTCSSISAQVSTADSANLLQSVEVKAFEQNRKLTEVAAAVTVIPKSQLNRFSNISILPALNSQPGIRMEERSPGSYRINIRGSSLRSPFGVRNVKVYYNDIPYTTPGGDSYFNQLGFYSLQSIEIIKGPGSSLYGAGTGGVLLVNSDNPDWKPSLQVDAMGGSFHSYNFNLHLNAGSNDFQNSINYQKQGSDGYRTQTQMKREVFSWDLNSKLSDRSQLQAHFLYSDLYYQTPGGLNQKEFDSIPTAARPRVGATPGAVQAQAAIYQKTFLTGVHHIYKFNDHLTQSTSLYGAFTQLRNPGIFNYSRTSEPHTGGRTFLQYKKGLLTAHIGAELQQGFTNAKAYKNVNGNPDSLRTDDDVNNRQLFFFGQVAVAFKGDWIITSGLSVNKLKLSVTRLSSLPVLTKERNYSTEIAPRLAILKKLNKRVSVYASISKGFSPPTNSELLPSSGIISTDLEAEKGISFEFGSRGNMVSNRFYYDINLFYYQLKNAIVVRRDNLGRDYFVNAGNTSQKGVESYFSYQLSPVSSKKIYRSLLWVSHTFYDFEYSDFKKGTVDYTGNKLPSVPKQAIVIGLDIAMKVGVYTNLTYNYSDKIALNDANTDYASSYHLLSARLGWKRPVSKKVIADIFFTGENLFDAHYSLGHDLNAAGGRYFNTAPGRNYIGGMSIQYKFR